MRGCQSQAPDDAMQATGLMNPMDTAVPRGIGCAIDRRTEEFIVRMMMPKSAENRQVGARPQRHGALLRERLRRSGRATRLTEVPEDARAMTASAAPTHWRGRGTRRCRAGGMYRRALVGARLLGGERRAADYAEAAYAGGLDRARRGRRPRWSCRSRSAPSVRIMPWLRRRFRRSRCWPEEGATRQEESNFAVGVEESGSAGCAL